MKYSGIWAKIGENSAKGMVKTYVTYSRELRHPSGRTRIRGMIAS